MMHRFWIMLLSWISIGTLSGAGWPIACEARADSFTMTVHAGLHDRENPLVTFEIPAERLDPAVVQTLQIHPVGLRLTDLDQGVDATRATTIAQLDRRPDGTLLATWFVPRSIRAGETARFAVDGGPGALDAPVPWSVRVNPGKSIAIGMQSDRPIFQYNTGPTTPPTTQQNPLLVRDAYIHPAYSPAGALVTGDFSPFHPHHRGFFLAYVNTQWGGLNPDFWNIHHGTGRIVAAGSDPAIVGPVTCRLAVHHRWEALRRAGTQIRPELALREDWQIEAYAVPNLPFWLFDLTTTQQAELHPLIILPHRYGGMAYRSAEPSIVGPLDVLTAEGKHRSDGDQKPTRWVDLTGPVAEASPKYAGAMIADHPSNLRYPTVVRIHPITLPFFSYTPAHAQAMTIATDRPTRFRYRILIHDGHPNPALNDRIAADFAFPPVIELD